VFNTREEQVSIWLVGLSLGFWALPSTFFDFSTPYMRKVEKNAGKQSGMKKEILRE